MGFVLKSFWTELAVFGLSVWMCFYLWVKMKYRFFKKRGVPYLKPTFLFGSTWRGLIGLEPMSETIKRCYKELKGHRMGGIFQGVRPAYMVLDPDLVLQVCVKDFGHFHDRPFVTNEKVNPSDGNLFMLAGPRWRALRNKLSPTFTSGKLKMMFGQIVNCGQELVDAVQVETTRGDTELLELLARFTTDVIASCAFGLEPECIKNPDSKLRELGREIFRPKFRDIVRGTLRAVWPSLLSKLRFRSSSSEVLRFLSSVLRQAFEHRTTTGARRNDFVQLLLELKEKGEVSVDAKDYQDDDFHTLQRVKTEETVKLEFTDGLLTAQAIVFFAAGFETTATSVSYTLYMLAKHPEYQDKAREEVKRVKKKHGDITYEAVRDMTYLDACFSETTRLHTPIRMLTRLCTKECVVDGVTIEKGTQVMVPVVALQLDPEYYPNPLTYDPERFTEGRSPPPGTFLPFGEGPRVCIGKRFAKMEAVLVLAIVLDKFAIHPSGKMKEPVKLVSGSLFNKPEGGIWVRFTKLEGKE